MEPNKKAREMTGAPYVQGIKGSNSYSNDNITIIMLSWNINLINNAIFMSISLQKNTCI